LARKALLENEELTKAAGYRIKYHPWGAAKELFTCHNDEILMAGPAGTGKSLAILHKLHLVLSKYPLAKGFMSRKTRTSMTNSCLATYQSHVLRPPDKVHFHKQDQVFNYPNGSMLAIVGLDDPERIKSTDWDLGFIQEATECTENDAEICTTRLRNWVVPYQQMLYDCNPDKPTHWLKRRCDQGLTTMLVSHHEDNPRLWDHYNEKWTTEGMQYLAKLQRLTGVRRARLYSGQWVAAEGIVYDQWDAQTHLISQAQLPLDWTEWPHYWAIDWGYTHPLVWQDWMEDPQGRLYLNRQIYRTRTLVEDIAAEIMDLTAGLPPPKAIICDHDAGDRAVFERHTGYLTLPAYKSIQIGIQAVQKRLQALWDGQPGIFILRDSLVSEDQDLAAAGKPLKTEDEWDGYVWDLKHNRQTNSKKDELPVDLNNHGMDALRYMVAFVDSLADDPEEVEGLLLYDDEVRISPY
jgi:phage terminase large subunit